MNDAPGARVLVVEDDRPLRLTLARMLGDAGHLPTAVGDGLAALQALAGGAFEVVLLDIGLPLADGWHVLQQLQQADGVPVIVVSARGDERDKVRALDLGADDYLAKPFGADELLARIRALLRRTRRSESEYEPVVRHGEVVVDLQARSVLRSGVEVRLSPTEFALLAELARSPGQVLESRTLLTRVWGLEYAGERKYLRTFIQRLRSKLEDDPAAPVVIVTVGRLGYRFGSPRAG